MSSGALGKARLRGKANKEKQAQYKETRGYA